MTIQREFSQTQRLVLLGILSGMATLLMYLEIPWPLGGMGLAFDLSDVVVLVALVILGVKEGFLVGFLKALIHFAIGSINNTAGVGEVAAFLASSGLLVGFLVSFKYFKLDVIKSLILTVLFNAFIMTFLNWIIITPLFFIAFGGSYPNLFSGEYVWTIVSVFTIFNLAKGTIIVSIFYVLVRSLKLNIEL